MNNKRLWRLFYFWGLYGINGMGISNLSRVCAAVLFAAALTPAFAAVGDKPRFVYNPATKTYIPTAHAIITPNGTVIDNSAAAQAQRFLDGQGGFKNKSTVHANFPAVKKTVPITIDAKTPASTVKLGAKNLLKGGLVGIAITAGLDQLFDGLDWVMGEGGKLQKKLPYLIGSIPDTYTGSKPIFNSESFTCHGAGVQFYDTASNNVISTGNCTGPVRNRYMVSTCSPLLSNNPLIGFNSTDCYYGAPIEVLSPLSDPEIESGVDSSYVPHLDDWDWLAPYMDPAAIEITDLPRLMSPPVTKTIYDADGNPVQVSETNIWHDFDIRNNDSARPEIDVQTTEETKVYENGTLISTNTTTSTSAADPDASTSGGDDFEIPTDCDFMPTVCAFLDWFKDDDLGEDPDLKSIMKDDEEFARSKTISFGTAVCPSPHTINLPSLGMSVDLSFEFFCQFAEYARALVLAAAYIFAAYISLGVARG